MLLVSGCRSVSQMRGIVPVPWEGIVPVPWGPNACGKTFFLWIHLVIADVLIVIVIVIGRWNIHPRTETCCFRRHI